MRILVLGGTRFLGPHVVHEAVGRGHVVTVFNRGQTSDDLPPDVERRRGDRDGGLGSLSTGRWDAVVDTCGYVPRVVHDAAALLAPRIGTYVFISSISAYAAGSGPITEDSPLETVDDPSTEDVQAAYGGLKALCERAAIEATDGRACAVRPGLIVGPGDPTGRFTYWPHRLARGGDVLLFDAPERVTQLIDVRDLAAFTVDAAERGLTGAYNATGRAPALTLGELVKTTMAVTGSDVRPVWVSEAFLADHEVGAWMELPLWVPSAEPNAAAFVNTSIDRALAAGLTFRPLAETIRATLAGAVPVDGVGLTAEREAALLAAWAQRD